MAQNFFVVSLDNSSINIRSIRLGPIASVVSLVLLVLFEYSTSVLLIEACPASYILTWLFNQASDKNCMKKLAW